MNRAYAALALLSVMTLLPRCAEAQGFDGADGSYATSPGVTPMDFLGAADGCPYTAMALYQQYMQQTQPAGTSLAAGSRMDSTTGNSSGTSNRSAAKTVASKKKKKKRPTTSIAKLTTTGKAIPTGTAKPGSAPAGPAAVKSVAKVASTTSG